MSKVVLVAVIALLAGGCTGDKPAASARATRTVLLSRRPVTASGHLAPGYRITRRLNGADCHDGSEAIGAAYRCFGPDNGVYDPCWRYATQAPTVAVLCLQDPFGRDVTALTARTLEPIEGEATRFGGASPWGLRLADGLTCTLEQGARDQYRGRVIDYSCGRRGELNVLRGLHRTNPLWTADTARWNGHAYEAGPTLAITTAVYGRA